MSGFRYKCSVCEEWHEGVPDIVYDRPLPAQEVPEGERAQRLKLSSDLCAIDGASFFIRCLLPIPIRNTKDEFCWGVWSSLSEENFRLYLETYDQDQSHMEPMFGWLSNRLPTYPDTFGLKLSVQPQHKGDRPRIAVEPTDHPLAIEQRNGITLERLTEIGSLTRHH